VPWSEGREHVFDNLIALCPNCHSRFDRGEIDSLSMTMYKRNLGLLGSRYGEAERRLLDMFAQNPSANVAAFSHPMDFEFMYLLRDELIRRVEMGTAIVHSGPSGTFRQGPVQYVLTDAGAQLLERLRRGAPVEESE
jgi:hypothetical protein